MDIEIRREKEEDYRTVEELTREAFWNLYFPGCDEHYVTHVLRKHPDFIPELDYVAVVDGKIVGNIMYSRSWATDETGRTEETLTFGPLCVLPNYQHKGIGSALINHTKKLALEMDEKAIVILGDPHNYCRHGFRNTIDFGVSDTEGRYPCGQLILELEKGFFSGHEWKWRCSPVFDLDENEVEEFDKTFPAKEKKRKYSQEEFSIIVRAFLG